MTDRDKRKLVGLVGYPETGKDALAKVLVNHYGWTRVAFGDAVKEALLEIDPTYQGSLEMLESTKRAPGNVTRMKLQGLGAWARRLLEDVWIDKIDEKLRELYDAGKKVVVTDIRYHNEASYVKGYLGSIMVGITREGYGPVNQHESEMYTGQLLKECPVVLENNDKIESLAVRFLTCV